MATITTLKGKKSWLKEVLKLFKDSLETAFTIENFSECHGELISNKSVKHNKINSRECLSLPKEDLNHDHSTSNDDTVRHDNSINHDDICVLKEDFSSYQVKMHKRATKC